MAVTQTQILDTTCRLVAQRGVHAVTTADIGRAAQVSPGTLFRHFATKDLLLAAALDYAQGQLCAGVVASPAFPRDTVYDTIRRVWTATAERALGAPFLFTYWVLVGATPGMKHAGLLRLPAFRGVERLLVQVLSLPALQADLLAWQLEAQWVATLTYVLRCQDQIGTPLPDAAALLAQGYEAWWTGVSLSKQVPIPRLIGSAVST